jgi:hypothetical protein
MCNINPVCTLANLRYARPSCCAMIQRKEKNIFHPEFELFVLRLHECQDTLHISAILSSVYQIEMAWWHSTAGDVLKENDILIG